MEVVRQIEFINRCAAKLNGTDYGVFKQLSLRVPELTPPQLGFIRSVSWLYALCHEVGRVGVQFVCDRIEAYGLNRGEPYEDFPRLVEALRTYTQHNLDLQKTHDRLLEEVSEDCMRAWCGSRAPSIDEEWAACLTGLLSDAEQFLKLLHRTLRAVEEDETKDEITRQWRFQLDRYHAPYEFDDLVTKAAIDMGRDHIDAVRIRKRSYDTWCRELRRLDGEYDFAVEARKLIEHVLLTDTIAVMPITGADIMKHFDLSPGPEVGEMLRRALEIYDRSPCSGKELLERLNADCR